MRQHGTSVMPAWRWATGHGLPVPNGGNVPMLAPLGLSFRWAIRRVMRRYAMGLGVVAAIVLACGNVSGPAPAPTPGADQNIAESSAGVQLCATPPAEGGGSAPALLTNVDESTGHVDRPPRVQIVLALDATSSYRFFVQAREVAIANLRSLLRPGFPGADVFVLLITSDSYGAEQLALDLPAVPLPPTAPVELVPPEQPSEAACDAFDAACRKRARLEWQSVVARCKRLNELGQSDYSAAVLVYQAAHAAVSAKFDTELQRLANLQVATDGAGTDLCGFAKAAELLARGTGERWFVVASDWDFNDARCSDPDLPGFSGARVQAFFFQCALADICKARRDHWTEVFQRIGALGVRWRSPIESYNASDLFEIPR
ncbi:MAG: hypothetical protein AB7F89_06740 [Pirellulaceae bacterium]